MAYNKAAWKRYYDKNPEKLRAKKLAYYHRHKAEILEKRKAYHEAVKNDPERKKRRNAAASAWRAKKREQQASHPMPSKCECCGRGGKLFYDHNHVTGLFRGWLCRGCNTALGFVGDNPWVLDGLIKYLARDFFKNPPTQELSTSLLFIETYHT